MTDDSIRALAIVKTNLQIFLKSEFPEKDYKEVEQIAAGYIRTLAAAVKTVKTITADKDKFAQYKKIFDDAPFKDAQSYTNALSKLINLVTDSAPAKAEELVKDYFK